MMNRCNRKRNREFWDVVLMKNVEDCIETNVDVLKNMKKDKMIMNKERKVSYQN